MSLMIGRNRNTNTHATTTTVSVGVTAVTLVSANPYRTFFSVSLDHGSLDCQIYVRLYEASQDNLLKGAFLLTRKMEKKRSVFMPYWQMPEYSQYTGEISAISVNGTFNVHVTEY